MWHLPKEIELSYNEKESEDKPKLLSNEVPNLFLVLESSLPCHLQGSLKSDDRLNQNKMVKENQ